jgi:hypothetical protein
MGTFYRCRAPLRALAAVSGFLARQKQRRQLRIVDGAPIVQRRCARVRAIAREGIP